MKIALVIYGSLDTLSGGYLYDRKLVGELRAAGHTVEIVSLPWRNYASHLTDNVQITWIKQLLRGGYDLILQDELNHPSLVLTNRILRRYFAGPLISIVHHLRSEESHPRLLRRFYDLVETAYLRTLDGFIFNSATSRRVVQARLTRPADGVIAYPAADHIMPPTAATVHARLQSRQTRNGPLRLLFVGNLSPRKALHTVLDSLALLPAGSWHLDVVGSTTTDPVYTQTLMTFAARQFPAGVIHWHGRIDDNALRERYSAADVFVAPSYEGFGIVYLEAMAFGLPVIASTAGAAHEIVTPGQDGYLVAPGNAAGLAAHLHDLIRNPAEVSRLAHAARERYDRHGTWRSNLAVALQWLHEAKRQSPNVSLPLA